MYFAAKFGLRVTVTGLNTRARMNEHWRDLDASKTDRGRDTCRRRDGAAAALDRLGPRSLRYPNFHRGKTNLMIDTKWSPRDEDLYA
ncbi:hypothetical protein EVAR_87369_1 [Eumeta japonica]|uniref:Uncharacterized protein n=1 Tax=Eumeta variegata TaxID=151549 RepID=A0A4C1Y0Q7_EUMVA|nr:hypothetical protein EVAR_87369_1 [Eumeta japonica]